MSPSSPPALPPELQVTNKPWLLVGISSVTFWRLRKQGRVLEPLDLPTRKNVWRVVDILDWFKNLKPRGSHRDGN
jgi:hypothetical protein